MLEWKILLDGRALIEWYLGLFAGSLAIALRADDQGAHGTHHAVPTSEAVVVGGDAFLLVRQWRAAVDADAGRAVIRRQQCRARQRCRSAPTFSTEQQSWPVVGVLR